MNSNQLPNSPITDDLARSLTRASVLDCGSPLPLSIANTNALSHYETLPPNYSYPVVQRPTSPQTIDFKRV